MRVLIFAPFAVSETYNHRTHEEMLRLLSSENLPESAIKPMLGIRAAEWPLDRRTGREARNRLHLKPTERRLLGS